MSELYCYSYIYWYYTQYMNFASDISVLANVGHHLVVWSLYKIILEFYDGKC